MPIRVTQQSLYDNSSFNILNDYARYQKQQALVSSGKSILQASDNPIEEDLALQTRSAINSNEQFDKNLSSANGWVQYTDQNLNSVISALQSAKQQVVEVSNDVNTAPGSPQRTAAAQSVNALLEEMVSYGNAQYENRYIYSGFKTDTPPFTATRNASGQITAVTYNGNLTTNESIQRDVSLNTRIPINVDGKQVFIDPSGAGGSTTGATGTSEQIFNELIQLRNDLTSNKTVYTADGSTPPYTYPNMQYLSQHLTALTHIIDKVDTTRASLGAKADVMTRLQQQNLNQKTNLQTILSGHEDLDMAKGALQLTNQLNLYQAAISAGAKIMSPSLMQFLK